MLSSRFAKAGLRVAIMDVFELPLKALDSSRVSLELLNPDRPLSPCSEGFWEVIPSGFCWTSSASSTRRPCSGCSSEPHERLVDERELLEAVARHFRGLLVSRQARSRKMISEATMVCPSRRASPSCNFLGVVLLYLSLLLQSVISVLHVFDSSRCLSSSSSSSHHHPHAAHTPARGGASDADAPELPPPLWRRCSTR